MKKNVKVNSKKQQVLLEIILNELLVVKEKLHVQQIKSNVITQKPQQVNIFGLAEYLNESPQAIFLKVKRKELPYTKFKNQTIFNVDEIDLFLEITNDNNTNC
ncbi:hypothetical protein [Flavobacterium panacagri]|uniref:hypothetical protein n=1 Tax=Flavobacterium panacagri TaxID=3034146 RepID=UPI0025A56762|nr:hypothetical protein [Flavobacterium panacagri]